MQDEEKHQYDRFLDSLREQVLAAMHQDPPEDEAELARLAADYRAFHRMGHAPRRARRLAEQILFQQRDYQDGQGVDRLALGVTATLADIYAQWLGEGKGRSHSGQ